MPRRLSKVLFGFIFFVVVAAATFVETTVYATSSTQTETILATARSKIGSTSYNGYCQRFVRICYESAGLYATSDAATALAAWEKWGVSTSAENIPVGATVYFASGSSSGHVGIYSGDGKMIHALTTVCEETISSYWWSCYLGWGYQSGQQPTGTYVEEEEDETPDAPVLTKIAVSTNGVRITWENVENADAYRVYRNSSGGSWTRIKTVTDSSTTTWLDTTAVAGETYTYTVKAVKNASTTLVSSYDKTGLSITVAPKKVTLVGATTSCEGNEVTWKAVNAYGYRIYRKTSGGKWAKIATLKGKSTTSYTDATAVSGETYFYTVRAYYKTGSSVGLGEYDKTGVSVTTWSLAAPVLKKATAVGYKTIKLSWKAVEEATGYRVYRKVSGGKWSRVMTLKNSSKVTYKDTVPDDTETYIYTVKAYYKRGSTTIWSSYDRTGVSAQAVPETPTLQKISRSARGIRITWEAVTADGYRIYRKTETGKWTCVKSLADGTATTWLDTTVETGETYFYTVKAYFSSGKNRTVSSCEKPGLSAVAK